MLGRHSIITLTQLHVLLLSDDPHARIKIAWWLMIFIGALMSLLPLPLRINDPVALSFYLATLVFIIVFLETCIMHRVCVSSQCV